MTDASNLDPEARQLLKVWSRPKGWRAISAVNNSEVGRWYAAAAFIFLLFAGVLALLMRIQLAVPENDFVSADTYNQLFTLHGSIMMFLFAVPMFEAISIMLLPEMLGARDLPFPRLSAYGFWCFVIGGVFVSGSIFFDVAPRSGWFMYPPLTTQQSGLGADIWLLGLSFIEIASIAAAVELIIGVLKCRPPGMRINLIPLYAWYVLVVGVMILFAFPPLIAGDLLFEMERAFDWPFFDVSRGGDPLLWQHLFWIFGHPEVYIIFLPTIAILAMVIPTFAQREIFGYNWIVLSAIGTGFLSFALWVHHMFTVGLPAASQGYASAASLAVAIPTGIQLFAFLATLLAGKVILRLPMLFVFGSVAIFVLGGLTGIMVAVAPFDWQVHDTYFVVAHLHYTIIGGMGFSVIAGIYYFYPAITGRALNERWGLWVFWLIFIGFNITFLPMHLTGLLGMPRRVFTYLPGLGWDWLNMLSTVGAFVIAAGMALFTLDLIRPKSRHPWSPRNPWNAGTLEWLTEMPGKPWGVRSIPAVTTRYPLLSQPDLMERVDSGQEYLPDASEGKRETLITTVLDARPVQCMRVGGPSFLSLWAAVFTGGFFIFATFSWYWTAFASGLLALASILTWLWRGTGQIPEKERKDVGKGLVLPIYASGHHSCGWWAMFITMFADITAFLSLIFGFFFYWTVNADYPFANLASLGLIWPGLALAGIGGAWLLTWHARHALDTTRAAGQETATALQIGIAAGLALFGVWALIMGPAKAGFDPVAHVFPAITWLLLGWTALHALVGVIMLLFCIAGLFSGRLSKHFTADLHNVTLYWHFLFFTLLVTLLTCVVFPRLA